MGRLKMSVKRRMYLCAATTQICISGYLILTVAEKDGTHKDASGHGLYDYKWNYCALQDMIHTTTSDTTAHCANLYQSRLN